MAAVIESINIIEQKRRCQYNWIKLVLSTLIPVVLGIFTVIYSFQQDKLAGINREQEMNIALENRKQDLSIAKENAAQDVRQGEKLRMQTAYNAYIADISKFILNRRFNRSDADQLMYIRIQTLNVLNHIDLNQKRQVIVFLYENCLIYANSSNHVNLRGADITDVKFARSTSFLCELTDLYLAGVLADNILFDDCQIQRSVFNEASLKGAKFFNSLTYRNRYEGADMARVVFNLSNTLGSNFASADLRNASFSGNMRQINFTNSDLFGGKHSTPADSNNIYINTRLPNGSFSEIDTKQLVMDGDAEILNCNGSSKYWTLKDRHFKLNITHKRYKNGSIQGVRNNCFFLFIVTSEAFQWIDVKKYSTFIDSRQAWCNISAYVMCRSVHPDDQAYVSMDFVTKDSIYYSSFSQSLKSKKQDTSFRNYYMKTKIPADTRTVIVRIGANIVPSTPTRNQTNECYIDDVKFFIFNELNVSSTPAITTTQNPTP